MGTYYHVYAEVKIGDKWCNLNPIIKKEDGSYGITTITWGQSRFYETWLHLEEHRIQGGLPEDCSEELRSVFHEDLDATADFLWKEQTYHMLKKNPNTVFIHIPSLKGMNETLMNKLADIF